MKTWLRLSLVTLTVGGGFVGIVLTPSFFEPGQGAFGYLVIVLSLLLNSGVMVSGLMFVHDPGSTTPVLAALVVQIPWVSSPLLLYQFSAGLKFVLTLSTPQEANRIGLHGGFEAWLGSSFRFGIMQDHPWGVGVNLVPLVLLMALRKSMKAEKTSIAPSVPSPRESSAAPSN